jgi:glycosyltransferase involved in cell wall biosynthesis
MAKIMNLRCVVTVHDVNSFDKKASRIVEKRCYSLIDGIIVHNESSRKDLLIKNVSIKRIAIIPHGNYTPFISKLPYNETNDVFTLLFFGQIKKVKGLDVLLKSVKLVKEKNYRIHLIVAGKAWKSDFDYYLDLIDRLDINDAVSTDFRYIPDNEVSSFYSRADLVVLPYTEIYQSGVLLLTMSYGRPVLCSDLNAFREIVIDGETGFLFQNKNERDLANNIIHIIQNKSILPDIIKNANVLIESKYNWVNIGRMTLDFYNSI